MSANQAERFLVRVGVIATNKEKKKNWHSVQGRSNPQRNPAVSVPLNKPPEAQRSQTDQSLGLEGIVNPRASRRLKGVTLALSVGREAPCRPPKRCGRKARSKIVALALCGRRSTVGTISSGLGSAPSSTHAKSNWWHRCLLEMHRGRGQCPTWDIMHQAPFLSARTVICPQARMEKWA